MSSESVGQAKSSEAADDPDGDPDARDITIGDLLREAAAQHPDRIALIDGSAGGAPRKAWTYAVLLEEAEAAAKALLARFSPGDRIAVWSPNTPEWVILEFATALAGMVLVPANPAYRQAELTDILQECEATALFHAGTWRGNDLGAAAVAVRDTVMPGLELVCLDQ